MARSDAWCLAPVAVSDPEPVWPLPDTMPRFWDKSFGGGRPSGCRTCERWHAGQDLIGAADGARVAATEDSVVIKTSAGWTKGTRALFLRSTRDYPASIGPSGEPVPSERLFFVYGGVRPNSHKEFGLEAGDVVRKGEVIARIHGGYGMLHFETYAANGRTANSRWWADKVPPEGIRNPLNYVQRAAGRPVTHVLPEQKHRSLTRLGFYKGPNNAPWTEESVTAVKSMQRAFDLDDDGLWGEKTEERIAAAIRGLGPAKPAREDSTWKDIAPWLVGAGFTLGLIVAARRRWI